MDSKPSFINLLRIYTLSAGEWTLLPDRNMNIFIYSYIIYDSLTHLDQWATINYRSFLWFPSLYINIDFFGLLKVHSCNKITFILIVRDRAEDFESYSDTNIFTDILIELTAQSEILFLYRFMSNTCLFFSRQVPG